MHDHIQEEYYNQKDVLTTFEEIFIVIKIEKKF